MRFSIFLQIDMYILTFFHSLRCLKTSLQIKYRIYIYVPHRSDTKIMSTTIHFNYEDAKNY